MSSLPTAGLLALVVLVGVAPVPPGKDAKKALEALQGEWRVSKSGTDHAEMREVLEGHGRVVIKGAKATLLVGEGADEVKFAELSVKVAPGKKPAEIDLTIDHVVPIAGAKSTKGTTIKGIYSLDGDTLKLYVGEDAAKRPRQFPAKGTRGVMVLERAKAKK